MPSISTHWKVPFVSSTRKSLFCSSSSTIRTTSGAWSPSYSAGSWTLLGLFGLLRCETVRQTAAPLLSFCFGGRAAPNRPALSAGATPPLARSPLVFTIWYWESGPHPPLREPSGTAWARVPSRYTCPFVHLGVGAPRIGRKMEVQPPPPSEVHAPSPCFVDAPDIGSPTRGLDLLAALAKPKESKKPAAESEEEELAEADAGLVVADAVVEAAAPPVPPSAADQLAIIARQQQEITALRELVAQQATAIEQMRRAASSMLGTSGGSPPPLYGPASPSTECAPAEVDLEQLSPDGRKGVTGGAAFHHHHHGASAAAAGGAAPARGRRGGGGARRAVQPAAAAAHAAHQAVYSSAHDPLIAAHDLARLGAVPLPHQGDGRPASAASGPSTRRRRRRRSSASSRARPPPRAAAAAASTAPSTTTTLRSASSTATFSGRAARARRRRRRRGAARRRRCRTTR